MKGHGWGIIAAILGACVLASVAAADSVVLDSGTRINGEALVLRDSVRIHNQDGVLTISLLRVREVIRTGSEAAAPEWPIAVVRKAMLLGSNEVLARAASDSKALRAASLRGEANETNVPPSVGFRPLEALESPVSVDFHETALVDAISYIQEITRGNVAYSPSELSVDPTPVTLKLDYVPLRQALSLLLEGRGLQWEVVGDVIRIGTATAAGHLELRRYDVRDLIVNTEDTQQGPRDWSRPSSRYEDDVTNAQYQTWDQSSNQWWGQQGGGGWGTYGAPTYGQPSGWQGGYGGQSASERAYDLARLITETVRPETWAQPPVVWIGRDRQAQGASRSYESPWEGRQ